MQDRVAVAAQRGPDPRHGVVVAAREHREPPGRDVVRAAADRRVHDPDAARGGAPGDGRGRVRIAGGVQDDDRSARHPVRQRPADAHFPDLVVVEDAHQDGGRALPGGGGVGYGLGAVRGERRARLGRPAQHADLVAGPDEAAHHRAAHPAGSDESEAHRPLLFARGRRTGRGTAAGPDDVDPRRGSQVTATLARLNGLSNRSP
nr:hypothetical protein [Actinomadura rifamycini]